MMLNMLYVVVVEDDRKAMSILKEYIECDDIKVVAVYPSGEDALHMIPSLPLPDVVLVDIRLPGISGIEVTRILKEKYPDIEIVVQTVFEDSKTIMDAIIAGASGYLLKASPRDEIRKALWTVKNGGSFLTGKVARKLLQSVQDTKFGKSREEDFIQRFGLTEREEQILREIMKGFSYKEIAETLSISVHTVNNHIRKVYEKMRVNSRGEAVAKASMI